LAGHHEKEGRGGPLHESLEDRGVDATLAALLAAGGARPRHNAAKIGYVDRSAR
jgi:hypothetical protein